MVGPEAVECFLVLRGCVLVYGRNGGVASLLRPATAPVVPNPFTPVPIVRRRDSRMIAPMRLALFALALLPCLQEPKPAEFPAEGTHDRTLEHGGLKRTYRIHYPAGFSKEKPVPLVFVLHGLGSTGRQTEWLTGFTKLSDEKGFAVVYPDGYRAMWRFWDGILENKDKVDDLGFLVALLDELIRLGGVDAHRVYATGISNGGFMANRLGVSRADRFAAIAPVAGMMIRRMSEELRPSRAVPTIYFHGTEDSIVPYDGEMQTPRRTPLLGAEDLCRWWAKTNGCGMEPKIEALADEHEDRTRVERWTWSGGKEESEVVLYKIVGGGHTWPGGPAIQGLLLGRVTREIDASALIWDFFSRFRLPGGK